jgi:predicted O-methyltransferase YrrM
MNAMRKNRSLGELLSALHRESDEEVLGRARSLFRGDDEAFSKIVKEYGLLSPEEKGKLLRTHGISIQDPSFSLCVSPGTGEFLFNLVLSSRPERILELGSSNGVSTLYLAEALRLMGQGKVVATESEEKKCRRILQTASAVGLSDFIELRKGDVFATVDELSGPFDLVFIDIWAAGYLGIFRKVEPLLTSGSIIVADNMYTAFEEVYPFKEYLDERTDIVNTTLDFESGVEFGVVLGRGEMT